jgi:thiamine transport system permease protein
MAERRQPIGAGLALATVVAAVAAGLVPVARLAIDIGFSGATPFDAYLWRIVRFTALQAGLSAAISLIFGLVVALALAHSRFWGRTLLLRLYALPMALPAITVVLGIVEVYGRSGWLGLNIYGLSGILLAHVFFNMPLAARLLLQRLEAIPPENWRLAAELGFGPLSRFRFVEWPALRAALGGTFALIFLLCAASFAVVLTLGGGPQATTLEVAIYQALRFDFDPARATTLAIVQLVLSGLLAALAWRAAQAMEAAPPLRTLAVPPNELGLIGNIGLGAVILIAVLFVGAPVFAILLGGIAGDFEWNAIIHALTTSLLIAISAAGLCLFLAWHLSRPGFGSITGVAANLGLIVPPAVLATGWFLAALGLGISRSAAAFLVIAMNALMALPFAVGTLAPARAQAALQHDRLCDGLSLSGWTRFRLVDFAVLRKPLGLAVGLSFAASLGDLTAVTFFGSQDLITLPALIYAQMGSYRTEAAAATALVLSLFSLAAITLAERRQ